MSGPQGLHHGWALTRGVWGAGSWRISFFHPGWWGLENSGGEESPEPKSTVETLERTAQQRKMMKGTVPFRADSANRLSARANRLSALFPERPTTRLPPAKSEGLLAYVWAYERVMVPLNLCLPDLQQE